jgi:hypothetical protein
MQRRALGLCDAVSIAEESQSDVVELAQYCLKHVHPIGDFLSSHLLIHCLLTTDLADFPLQLVRVVVQWQSIRCLPAESLTARHLSWE